MSEVARKYEGNQKWWDERARLHAESDFYNLASVVNGADRLGKHEPVEMGSVVGKTLLHLQCHLGTETIGWARRGAVCSGLDFSPETVTQAKILANACGLEIDYRLGNVYDAVETFEGKNFDRVYVNIGSIHYLHDIDRWGRTIGRLLKRGGKLYMDEIHPVSSALAEDSPTFIADYFSQSGQTYDEDGSYTDTTKPTNHNEHTVWDHPLGSIINSVIKAGLRLDFLNERPGGEYQQFNYQTKTENGLWVNPPGYGVFPSMFSLMATKA